MSSTISRHIVSIVDRLEDMCDGLAPLADLPLYSGFPAVWARIDWWSAGNGLFIDAATKGSVDHG